MSVTDGYTRFIIHLVPILLFIPAEIKKIKLNSSKSNTLLETQLDIQTW